MVKKCVKKIIRMVNQKEQAKVGTNTANKKVKKITQWLSGLESLEKGNIEEFAVFTESMWERIGQCNDWDAVVVDSQKKLKKAWLSRPITDDF